jgi:transcriptional regulator with XRE-family HTH domain
VKTPAQPTNRATATFVPYFWEAYSQIARPDRFDWYLVTRWLPDLGPEAFTLVKVLRAECYFNPREGKLRDECQLTVDELAEKTGIKRSSLYRLLEGNEALRQFVQRLPEVIHVEGRTRRLPPRWRVCMDNPIHPTDMEEYELLRATRERDRAGAQATDQAEKRKSQVEIYEQRKSQRGERKSQNGERKSQPGISNKELSLPSGGFTKDSLRVADAAAVPPINPPGGEETPSAGPDQAKTLAPLSAAWDVALALLAGQVNKPTLETHLRLARLVSLSAAGDVVIEARSHFSREWIDGRHRAAVEAALAEALGTPLASLRILAGGK